MAKNEPKYIRVSDIFNSSSGSDSCEMLGGNYNTGINRLRSEAKNYENYFEMEDCNGGTPNGIQTPAPSVNVNRVQN